ncbi:zinc ribbon domain-containing protein [Diaphorobacter ruginosibacter]|uniref:Zinc ribbon domain-containing protein n=1 Tax=Diaphorobacter ruginosibacter TaxID=1715720 RepID=A0A7G9RR17_9BURK|nr:zinc ribbon domain-containing protein [Diaphorobacter ruginosibacter]QNN58042.1 zinc ribbon domain-containing protein [Diaphorobacter ruginosibacter]
MALVTCPECGHTISTQAAACPSCGYVLRNTAGDDGVRGALQSPKVWSTALLALGAWLVTPWIARLIVAIAVCVLAYFMFTGK